MVVYMTDRVINGRVVDPHVVVGQDPSRVLDLGGNEPGPRGERNAAASTNGLSEIRSEIPVVGVQLPEPKECYENVPRTL
jgi:hypothetical protein